ncbi:MAG: TPM domain-containing protein [Planctomycetaceae bacterium]
MGAGMQRFELHFRCAHAATAPDAALSLGRLQGARAVAAILLVGFVCWPLCAQAQIPSDALLKRLAEQLDERLARLAVHDFAGVLSAAEREELDRRCKEVRQKTGAALVVVTLKSLEGGEIDDFTNKLFAAWKPGEKGRDNGVMLLVAMEDRKGRIEVGYGLEPILPDALAGRVLDQQLFPAFKQERYAQGLQAAVERIAQIIERNEPAPAEVQHPGPELSGAACLILFLAIFVGVGAGLAGFTLASPKLTDWGPFWFGLLFVSVGMGIGCMVALLLALAIHVPVAAVGGWLGWLMARSREGGGPKPFDWTKWDWGNAGDIWGSGNWSSGGWTGGSWTGGGSSGGGFSGSWGGFGGGSSGGGGASGSW